MKYILFSGEVMRVPESVTFWVMNQGSEYRAQYCVNMSPLNPKNFIGEPTTEGLIRSEGYLTSEEAHERLNELLKILNQE